MSGVRPAVVTAVALALAATMLAVAAPHVRATPSAFPAATGRILVASEDVFGLRLTLLDATGRRVGQSLGAPFGVRSAASFAPNGTTLAMVSTISIFDEGADSELLAFSIAGGGEFLTRNAWNEGRPAWSPDGRMLAYASDRDGDWDVYLAPVDNADTPTLNLTAGSPASERNPRWSPDGTRVAFETNRSGDVDVYVASADGSGAVPVALSPGEERLGDWSPDSSRLVLSSDRAGTHDLYVVAVGGVQPARVTSAPGAETNAAWSPDGATIAFSSDRDGDTDVFAVRPDGSDERRLTNNASEDVVQDWQPLRDLRPPRVRALASSGRRGRPMAFRFRVDEDTRRAAIEIEIRFSERARGGGGSPAVTYVPGRTYTYTFPAGFGPDRPPASFPFCVRATDPSGNESNTSCARFRFTRRR